MANKIKNTKGIQVELSAPVTAALIVPLIVIVAIRIGLKEL